MNFALLVLYLSIDQDHSPRVRKDISLCPRVGHRPDGSAIDRYTYKYFEIDVSRKTNEFGRKVERKSIAWNGTKRLPFLFRRRRPDANARCKWLWEGKGDGSGSLTGTDHAPLFPGRRESIRRPCAHSARCTRVPFNPRNRTTVVSCF